MDETNKIVFDKIFTILDMEYSKNERAVAYKDVLSEYKVADPLYVRILILTPTLNSVYEILEIITNSLFTKKIVEHNCNDYMETLRLKSFMVGSVKNLLQSNFCDFCYFCGSLVNTPTCDKYIMKILRIDDFDDKRVSFVVECITRHAFEFLLELHMLCRNDIEYISSNFVNIVNKMKLKYVNTKIPVELYQEEKQELSEKDINDVSFYLS
jgi:hypothetical protein